MNDTQKRVHALISGIIKAEHSYQCIPRHHKKRLREGAYIIAQWRQRLADAEAELSTSYDVDEYHEGWW